MSRNERMQTCDPKKKFQTTQPMGTGWVNPTGAGL